MKHAAIIPLIGGEALAATEVFGKLPEFVLSYEAFSANEKHLQHRWKNEVNWYLLDKNERHPNKVDVVSSVCPCAGLSLYSTAYGSDNPANKWMIESSKFVLSEVKPEVYYGENAPALAGSIGKGVREALIQIGKDNGYSFSIYRTKSLLHGVPQVRERSFFFFFEGDSVPILEYYNRPYTRIEDLILSVKSNSQRDVINTSTPSQDPYYRYVLEEIHGGMSHRDFARDIGTSTIKDNDVLSYIESRGITYDKVGKWMREESESLYEAGDWGGNKKIYDREAARCDRMYDKITVQGKNIMRRQTIIPRDRMGAFVGHYPNVLAHPVEDRYIDLREAMTIMGLPSDYELLDPKKSVNHICQSVPVDTARDIALEVKAYLEGKRPTIKSDGQCFYQWNASRTHGFEGKKRISGVNLESFIE